jgi:PAS domain S-box-containing protein
MKGSVKKLIRYLSPLGHLGERTYSWIFPLLFMLSFCLLSEFYAYGVARNPMIVAAYAIFIPVALIIYLAFRTGIRGGLIASAITVTYYFYIIYTRDYTGERLTAGIETTIILGILYFFLAGTIGWLKETIDTLIEREANEKRRLQTIIDQLPVGILITDNKGILTQRNKQIDKILGMKIPHGFMIGNDRLVGPKINGAPMNPSQSVLKKALSSNKSISGIAITYEPKGGKKKFLQISSAPIHGSNKKIIAAASIISDVTKQKSLERQKDDFLGVASHELKTPVTSIKAYAQVLQRIFSKKGDKKAVDLLGKMDGQLNKLTALITDLLDVTKIEAGKLQFRVGSFDANTLIEEVIEDVQRTAPHHKIKKKLAGSKSVYGDRDRVGQVITNFLTNAIKYSPRSKQIIVSTKYNKETLIFSAQDFGIGIPKERQEKLFDRFYRGEGERESTYPGLGLGLYIASEIIKRLQGNIWVESEKGKGSTFYFSLPLKKPKMR